MKPSQHDAVDERMSWEKSLEALLKKHARLLNELHETELHIVEFSTRLGRDFRHLLRPTSDPEQKSYKGWVPIEAVRDYLRTVGSPQIPEEVVEALGRMGANAGNIRRAISGAMNAPGTRKDGAPKTPSLRRYPDGKIGLPEWPA